MSINNWTFSGRLGRDAETRYATSGKEITSAAVAVDIGWGDNKRTLWVECVMFGERYAKIAQYLIKGGKVTVSGQCDLNQYTAKDGTEKASLKCIVQDIDFSNGQQGQQSAPRQEQRQSKPPSRREEFDSDEIPFN